VVKWRALMSFALGLALTGSACDGGSNSKAGVVAPADAATTDATAADVAPPAPDAGPPPRADAASVFDAGPPEEVGTFELPRGPADPKLTRKLLPGSARLVGGDFASCTHAPGATGDRWCAFSQTGSGGATELWVIDITKVLAGAAAVCDGTSADCLRLTTTLWTGLAIYGPSHPSAHRFEGDTLIFHADEAPGKRDPFDGAIWAWRPTWKAARKLTTDHGVLCFGEHESTAIMCLDGASIERDGAFSMPMLRGFDLRAGTLDGDETAPLPLVGHFAQATGEITWRARFAKDGATLFYSAIPAGGGPETLYLIKTAEIGKATAKPILADAAEWELAHDGQKVYFLRGYDRSRGSAATGALMLADLPGGDNPVELQKSVLGFALLGAQDEVFTNVDRGVMFAYPGAGGVPAQALLLDRNKPTDIHLFGSKADVAQVSNDTRHTLTFQDSRGAEFPSAYVNHSDNSANCRLTSDYRAETYGAHFSDSSRLAFWIEFGRNQSQSEEGWYANPQTCGDKVKFGDFVGWYVPLGDDFVLFEGGDLDDSTRWLEYTSLRAGAGPNHPKVVQERTDGIVGILQAAGSVWTLFGVGGTDATGAGLFVHGPLAR
jgi:hypothetical protein